MLRGSQSAWLEARLQDVHQSGLALALQPSETLEASIELLGEGLIDAPDGCCSDSLAGAAPAPPQSVAAVASVSCDFRTR